MSLYILGCPHVEMLSTIPAAAAACFNSSGKLAADQRLESKILMEWDYKIYPTGYFDIIHASHRLYKPLIS